MSTASILNNKKNQYEQALVSANKEAGVDTSYKKLLDGKTTFNINSEGIKLTLEPKDVLGLNQHEVTKVFKFFNKAGQQKLLSDPNVNLTSNQRKLIANWDKLPRYVRQTVISEMNSYKTEDFTKWNKSRDKADELFNQKLSKIAGVSDTVAGTLPMGDSDQKNASIGKVAAYVNSGERNYGEDTDRSKVLSALNDVTSISWTGKKPTNSKEEWIGNIIVTGKDGVPYTITNVNRKDLTTFTDATFKDYKDQPIQDALNINEKTKSTNSVYMPNSPNAWRTAYFKGNQVNPEVIRAGWGYRADVVKSGGGYRLVNYVKPPGSQKFITVYGAAVAADENIIDNTYKTTTPAQLNAMYLNYLHNQNQNK